MCEDCYKAWEACEKTKESAQAQYLKETNEARVTYRIAEALAFEKRQSVEQKAWDRYFKVKRANHPEVSDL